MINDMTTGLPSKILLKFSLPMLGSVAFQQIYNIADSVIAGQCIGPDALSAVGASFPVTMIFMAIATGGSIGVSVVVSLLFGGKRLGDMKTAINTALISFLCLSLIVTLIGIVTSTPLMRLLNTPDNIFKDSDIYLKVYILGLIFLFMYNVCNGIFTAMGDSKTPFLFLVGSSLGNIVLDLLFVIVFRMGVSGVAWATFAAQGAACILSFLTLKMRLRKMNITEKSHRFSLGILKQIGRISIPSILQNSFISVGNLFIQGLVNGYGSDVIGGYSAAVKLNTFATTCFTTMSNGISNYVAQNIGAKKQERIHKGVKAGVIISICVSVPFIICFLIMGNQLVSLFADNPNDAILSTGSLFLAIVSPFYLAIGIKISLDGALRGAGAMRGFMISTFTDLIIRVIFAYALSQTFGTVGIWASWPIGWIIATVLSAAFYKRMLKQTTAEITA